VFLLYTEHYSILKQFWGFCFEFSKHL